jgi:hypothetical protein
VDYLPTRGIVQPGDTMVVPPYTVYGFMLASNTLFIMDHIIGQGETSGM